MAQSVGILTFHQADNYGAVLQAYGLAQAIGQLGHTAQIIDYRPAAARRLYNRFGLRSGTCVPVLTRRWRFRQFRRQYLPLSHRRYLNREALAARPPKLDCIICGSDQIWNVQSYRGFDPPFFLEFARDMDVTKASYAATFAGTTDFAPHHDQIVDLLRRFDLISVRDTASQNLVNDLVGRVPPKVVDPTFLTDFRDVTPPPIHRVPYIAVYCLEHTPEFLRLADMLSRKLGLPLVSIMAKFPGAHVYGAAGPRQWLSLMNGARFVLTNSFHGLCFAIKNRTDFLAAPHSKGPARLADLLDWFNLGDRLITDVDAVESMGADDLGVDYSRVEEPLQAAIESSREYLREVLRG